MASTKLGIEWLANGAANQTLANLTFATLNQVVQLCILDKDRTTAPSSPNDEDAYIVASGNWGTASSKAGQIAWWSSTAGAWQFIVPKAGWTASVLDEVDGVGASRQYVCVVTGGVPGWIQREGAGGATGSAVVTDATTARTLGLADNGTYIRFTNAGATALTVPPQSSVAWGAVTEIHVRRVTGAALTLTPGSGVTLNAPSGGTLVLSSAMTVTLKRVASDAWDVIGQTVPL
ncbi:MAG: DUF2793 domain-containing protein [Nocardiopsaceae bacterium]|jgi:hypothetical protein|nr:DUF2793 domain-containing protein [Nocardiopsaceae bacterium]